MPGAWPREGVTSYNVVPPPYLLATACSGCWDSGGWHSVLLALSLQDLGSCSARSLGLEVRHGAGLEGMGAERGARLEARARVDTPQTA